MKVIVRRAQAYGWEWREASAIKALVKDSSALLRGISHDGKDRSPDTEVESAPESKRAYSRRPFGGNISPNLLFQKFVLVVLLIVVLALGVRGRPDVSSFSSSSFGGHTSSSTFTGHSSGGSGGGGYQPPASNSAGGYGSSRGTASGTATINFNLGASKGGSRGGNGYGK